MNPIIQQALSFLDPSNQQAPVLGPIRKFNAQMFGQPDYANAKLPASQRINNALELYGQNFMGGHGGLRTPVKTGYQDILMNKRSAVDALKRYDTTLGSERMNANQPMLDMNLHPDLLKQWKIIYGANKKAPIDLKQLVYQVRTGLRAALAQTKQK